MAKQKLSWKPIRSGDVYCSPACGDGCRYDDYVDAQKKAKKLAAKVKGFKPHAFERTGWHFEAVALDAHVSVSGTSGSYLALASVRHRYSGTYDWGIAYAKTPQGAVSKLKRQFRREVVKMQKFLKRLEAANGK